MQYLLIIFVACSVSFISAAQKELPQPNSESPRLLALRNRMREHGHSGNESIGAAYQRAPSKLVIAQPLTPTASKSGEHTNRSIRSGSDALSVGAETKASQAQTNKLQILPTKKRKA